MKLLVVSPYLPSPSWGFAARSYYLLKMLERKHLVSLLTLVDNAEEEVYRSTPLLKDLPHPLKIISRPAPRSKRVQQLMSLVHGSSYHLDAHILVEAQETLNALLARECYDVVLFESVLIAGYTLPRGVKVIIDQHNIEHELLQRSYQHETVWLRKWYNWLEYRMLKPIEIERCRKSDIVLVTSERERLSLQSILPDSVIEVVPNGVDLEAFQANCSSQELQDRIIFTGSMDYYPNVQAVLFFAQKCWPLIRAQVPDVTWQIVGKNPLPEVWRLAELPGVTVTGAVPDVRPYLSAATIAIAPLLIGSGTRLKILEALAMQKAVVSTSIGCEGLSVVSGEHLMVVDQPEAFAQAVVTLLNNPKMRTVFGTAGRKLVAAEYSWEQTSSKLLHILEEMI